MKKYSHICAFLFLTSFFAAGNLLAQTDSLLRIDTAQRLIQTSKQNNAFFWEVLGNGGILSVNLDFRYQSHYSFRIGFGIYIVPVIGAEPNTNSLSGGVVTMINYLLLDEHTRLHYFNIPYNIEIGLGMVTDLTSHYRGALLPLNNTRIKPTLFLGFRFQPFSGNNILRVGYTPFFDLHEITHSFGVSYGYCIDPF